MLEGGDSLDTNPDVTNSSKMISVNKHLGTTHQHGITKPSRYSIMSGKKKDGGPNHRNIRKGQGYSAKVGGPGVRKPGRREWMKECLKLLEAMMDHDNSLPFREPVDCAKHPDYYTVVSDPIDLSKVNFKFRGNQYNDPDEFATDIRQLFENYSMYFKDPTSQIYFQLHELTIWFETQYKRIVDKWGFRWMHWHSNSSSQGGSTVSLEESRSCSPIPVPPNNQHPPPPPLQHMGTHSPPQTARSQSSDVYMPLVGHPVPHLQQAYPPHLPPQHPPGPGPGGYCGSPVPISTIPTPVYTTSTPVYAGGVSSPSSSHLHTYSTTMATCTTPTPTTVASMVAAAAAAAAAGQGYTSAASPHSSSPNMPPIPLISEPPPLPPQARAAPPHNRPLLGRGCRQDEPGPLTITVPDHRSPPSRSSQGGGGSSSHTGSHTSAESEPSIEDTLELTISNSVVWFGPTQLHTNRPIVLRETGLSFCVGDSTNHEFQIEIRADEIVRCVAQLGPNKKHTIFLFILPNCTKRLESLNSSRFSGCSLIVLFTAALSPSQISLMLHIFHNMSKNSIFGPLFSETDQDGALVLLSNIKPGILTRVAEKVKEVTASRSLDMEVCRMQDDEDTHSPGGGSLLTSHRLTVPIGQERRSLSLNDAPMVAERQAANHRHLHHHHHPHIQQQQQQQQQQHPGTDHRPLDLSSANTDNSMWNGAVHPNRNLSRTKFHFKQRSLEIPQRGGRGGGPGAGGGGGLLRKAQRQYAVDNGSDEEDGDPTAPSAPQSRSSDSELGDSVSVKHETSKQSSLSSSSRGSQGSVGEVNHTNNSNNSEQCSVSEDLVMTEVRMSNRCPITQQIMHEPVRNRCCSHVYDREGVEQLIKLKNGKASCPVPGCSNPKILSQADLVQDYEVWKQIHNPTGEDGATSQTTHTA